MFICIYTCIYGYMCTCIYIFKHVLFGSRARVLIPVELQFAAQCEQQRRSSQSHTRAPTHPPTHTPTPTPTQKHAHTQLRSSISRNSSKNSSKSIPALLLQLPHAAVGIDLHPSDLQLRCCLLLLLQFAALLLQLHALRLCCVSACTFVLVKALVKLGN